MRDQGGFQHCSVPFVLKDWQTKASLVAPYKVKSEILKPLHDSRVSGHLGRDKTLDSVKRRFFWPGMTTDVSVKSVMSVHMLKLVLD